jgi:putative ABC transport system permease protein
MASPRWKKLLRDFQASTGRMVMMVIAIAVSILALGAILSAYSILTREISRNYTGTNPASAYLQLDRVDDSVIAAVLKQPDIVDAEAGSWVMARIEISPNEWRPLLLFVVKDFNTMRLNTFEPQSGAFPPTDHTLLLERQALTFINAKVGDVFNVQTPNGPMQAVPISGSVHDPGLAPAWMEQMAYGYVTPSTLQWLGESNTLHILKVIVKNQSLGKPAIEATVSNLAQWLKNQGFTVGEIRVPPPLLHPHQTLMEGVMQMLLIFGLMALMLSAILTATIIGGMLAQQTRQIGIMKAIGARSRQINNLYIVLVMLLGSAAVVIGLPLSTAAGIAFSRVIAELLNFTLYSDSIPAWVFIVQLLMGIFVPLLAALVPIQRTTRITVRETLTDYGTNREAFGSRKLDSWLGKIRGVDKTLLLALRNTFRRQGRLILTLGLLAAGGGMFMAGINVKTSWDSFLSDAAKMRHYDLEIRLNTPQPEDKIDSIIKGIPGVTLVEAWNIIPVAVSRPDGLDIVNTYPDGGHGSFMLRAVPPESKLIDSVVLSGRWLQANDGDGVVLNHMAVAFFPNVKAGDMVNLMINQRTSAFRVIGIVRQNLTPASAYVIPDTFAAAAGISRQATNAVRIVLDQHDANTIGLTTGKIQTALAAENINIGVLISETMLEGATSGHVYIFIVSLITMAFVMAIVGVLGLMSSMGTSVIERTREFGIMRAIGAKSSTILRNIISEGVFIGLLSWLIAVILSLPLSSLIGSDIGVSAFSVPLGLIVSPIGLAGWFLIIVIGSIAASAFPAWQASRLTIRETLVYV